MSSALKIGFSGLLVVTVVVIVLWEPRPEEAGEKPGMVQVVAGDEEFRDRTSLVLGNPLSIVGIESGSTSEADPHPGFGPDLTLLGSGAVSKEPSIHESTPPVETDSSPVTEPVSTPESRTTAGSGFHLVAEGESLYRIARQHYGDGSLWRSIARANPSLDPGRLYVGRKIVIPTLDRTPPPATGNLGSSVEREEPSSVAVGEGEIHTVGPGDSLYRLAQRYYGSGRQWRRILDANPHLESWNLHPGMKIRIPPRGSTD